LSARQDFAANAIRELYELWQVEPHQSQLVGKPNDLYGSGFGFDWWPGDFRVQVRVQGGDTDFCRLNVRTDFLRGVDRTKPEFLKALAGLNRLAAGFALVAAPSILTDATVDPRSYDVWLTSVVYVYPTMSWLTRFFGYLALLQPIEAQARAGPAAVLLGGAPNVSKRDPNAKSELDDMLNAERDLFQAAGQDASRWRGTGEFEAIAERWGRNDAAFGMGDPTGLVMETPFGDVSALLQFLTDTPHPRLGNGLLSLAKLPVCFENSEQPYDLAAVLNYREATEWTESQSLLLGAWSAVGEGHGAGLAYGAFIPNVLYQPGIAKNEALQEIARLRWAREEYGPNVADLPMIEILRNRMGRPREA
jgi:hypothetical protein